jgi:signal transduction histidine kinase/CheY-like chemotaxis protein
MNPLLRTLEEWTTHQDYLWFLAALAWGGVLGAEVRRREHADPAPPNGWLVTLAISCVTSALLELLLLAQDLLVPYTRFDFAMGAAQAAATGAVMWQATSATRQPTRWRAAALAVLVAIAVVRVWRPVEAGIALCMLHTIAVGGVLRVQPPAFSAVAAVLLTLVPIVSTHGPWAYAINHGRRMTDWSHFSLLAAGTLTAAGAVLASAAWQRRLRQALPENRAAAERLRRELKRALSILVAWLVGGVLLAVWSGRNARQAYEENLLRRVEMAVLALDPAMVAEALSPELKVESIARRYDANRRPVDVATVPHSSAPVYAALRAQLGRLRERNSDFRHFYILALRQGQMLVLNSVPRASHMTTHVVHHAATPEDLARIAAGRSFLEGPLVNPILGAKFSAKAALLHPDTGDVLGWLVADVDSTRWAATFTQARLQTMALVAAGVGLWTLAVAYRLRRAASDAAERKAVEAAAADRMKSAFLAKVSHELRTPIQSVLGYGELLAGAPLGEPHRAWLAALRSHGGVMLRLVNDLIDLGALQSGAFQLERAPVRLAALADECAAALRPAAREKGLAFHVVLAADLPEWVVADGVRLRQVLLNLLTNAVKFTPAGRVTLTVQRGSGEMLEFIVDDTGPGIPVALRPRLFQPFARLDPAAKEGSGLGLALVQGLCAVMGGTVELQEREGGGARFAAQLPLPPCGSPTTAVDGADQAAYGFGGLRVLVAEDNTLVRELLVAFLTTHGADVMTVGDGLAALAAVRRRAPDVLLLDIALPGLDGIAVAEALRRDGPALRIIGLSAHASRQDELRARTAGMDEFLAKPVSLTRLAAALAMPQRGPAARTGFASGPLPDALRARLTEQFVSETPGVVAGLRLAVAAQNWPEMRSRAHYLKNSADIVGAVALQDACQQLATLADDQAAMRADDLLEAVESALRAAESKPATAAAEA